MIEKKIKEILSHWKVVAGILMVYDFVAILFSYLVALWLRFDCNFGSIPREYMKAYYETIVIYGAFCILIFLSLRLYKSIWKFASYTELIRMILATAVTGAIYTFVVCTFVIRMPVSYFIFGIVLQFGLTLGVRFLYRFILLLRSNNGSRTAVPPVNVMLIGAGAAGQMIFRDIRHAKEVNERVCCFIDDNSNKWGRYIDGVEIFGGRDSILAACEKYQIKKIYLAIPSASAQEKRDILQICNETKCELMNLPGMYQLYTGQVSVSNMRKVSTEDLLGRDPIRQDMTEVYEYIQNKVVMVTGVGSIGSELCRQIAAHKPKRLIMFDMYENNAYEIQQELKKKYPDLDLHTIIGSVRDSRKVFQVFETYRPQIVYHAAAHKHVPLMEDSPCEAIKNNAIGTYKTAFAATVYGTEKFVLISTDKAVNPTNIMGASKRLCEMVIQAFDRKIRDGKAEEIPQLFTHWAKEKIQNERINEALRNAKTEFVAVRFGNVLGSNGSVIPLFKKQIEAGGPVTVTHPDIIRYFMTIPEAVSLVLLAGTYAKGGEIFVLDMGEPVKIVTLAQNLIKMYGLVPGEDIEIVYSGLRPGEKLYEEKLMAEEGLKKTKNELIHIGCPIPFDVDEFLGQLEILMETAYRNKGNIRELVEKIVKTYHPA